MNELLLAKPWIIACCYADLQDGSQLRFRIVDSQKWRESGDRHYRCVRRLRNRRSSTAFTAGRKYVFECSRAGLDLLECPSCGLKGGAAFVWQFHVFSDLRDAHRRLWRELMDLQRFDAVIREEITKRTVEDAFVEVEEILSTGRVD